MIIHPIPPIQSHIREYIAQRFRQGPAIALLPHLIAAEAGLRVLLVVGATRATLRLELENGVGFEAGDADDAVVVGFVVGAHTGVRVFRLEQVLHLCSGVPAEVQVLG